MTYLVDVDIAIANGFTATAVGYLVVHNWPQPLAERYVQARGRVIGNGVKL